MDDEYWDAIVERWNEMRKEFPDLTFEEYCDLYE